MEIEAKASTIKGNNDIISQLPDEICSEIISLLPLNEAIRPGILSKRWVCMWTGRTVITCDHSSILGISFREFEIIYIDRGENVINTFIERVDGVIKQRCQGTKMDKLVIEFPLFETEAAHISKWVSTAVNLGVECVCLDLSGGYDLVDVSHHQRYTFHFSLLEGRKGAFPVKNLQLAACSPGPSSDLKSLISLVAVKLVDVKFSDEQLDAVLRQCTFLERLLVKDCVDFHHFNITNRNSRLKILGIDNCSNLGNVEIFAENLMGFGYRGLTTNFSFKHIPKMVKVILCPMGEVIIGSENDLLSGIITHTPLLETLHYKLILGTEALQIPVNVPLFTNIKRLLFSILPTYYEDTALWIGYFLKTFPSLEKLQLNQLNSENLTKHLEEGAHRQLPQVSHMNLRKLEIYGYQGEEHEVDLLKFILHSAVKLDHLSIDYREKGYEGLNEGTYFKLSTEKIEQVEALVPPHVCLKLL